MTRKRFAAVLIAGLTAGILAAQSPPAKPKLILLVAIDQFRYDYLTRFRGEYTGGFDRLLTKDRKSVV